MIFTFWEGQMPEYIRLCLQTWPFEHIMLNYDNLHDYTDIDISRAKRFTLPQIADCVRVHVLRDQGGYWLDADTIIAGDSLPNETILGNDVARTNSIGFLHTEPNSDMFVKWADYQDRILNDPNITSWWAIMGNAFTDPYLKQHTEIRIGNIYDYLLETRDDADRYDKYLDYYFGRSLEPELPPMIMLHNSWTPEWYRELSRDNVLHHGCTLSNILRRLL